MYDLRHNVTHINEIKVAGFDPNIDCILDFKGMFIDNRVQIFIIQRLTKQLVLVNAFSNSQVQNHLIDLGYLRKFIPIDFFQPEEILVIDYYNMLGKQDYFAVKDKVSVFIFEYN